MNSTAGTTRRRISGIPSSRVACAQALITVADEKLVSLPLKLRCASCSVSVADQVIEEHLLGAVDDEILAICKPRICAIARRKRDRDQSLDVTKRHRVGLIAGAVKLETRAVVRVERRPATSRRTLVEYLLRRLGLGQQLIAARDQDVQLDVVQEVTGHRNKCL